MCTLICWEGFHTKGTTIFGSCKGPISIIYFCEVSYNFQFLSRMNFHPSYIGATTFKKISFSRLVLKTLVGLLFMYALIFLFLSMLVFCSSGNTYTTLQWETSGVFLRLLLADRFKPPFPRLKTYQNTY